MSKRGPLSKIEKFYIENNLDQSVDELASELDRAKSVIKAYASKCEKKPRATEKVKENNITHLASQIPSSKGSTVMTENGSSLSDEFRKKSISLGKRKGCTTSIRG